MPGFSKERVLDLLRANAIKFDVHEHGAVMTCEAQVGLMPGEHCQQKPPLRFPRSLRMTYGMLPMQTAALAGVEGRVTKNLLLRVRGY